MHTDAAVHAGSEAIVASAQARGVPVVSARQMLDWIDGRNNSTFGTIAWDGPASTLAFTVTRGTGARNLHALLPASFGGKPLTSVCRGMACQFPFTTQDHQGRGLCRLRVARRLLSAESTVRHRRACDLDRVSGTGGIHSHCCWTTNELATTRVDFGLQPDALSSTATVGGLTASHSVQLVAGGQHDLLLSDPLGRHEWQQRDAPAELERAGVVHDDDASILNCPCSVWLPAQTPAQVTVGDSNAVELGLKFRTTHDGFITGVRFYKGPQNIGIHVGNLWTTTGTLLGTVTFANETASGWQQALFAAPVGVTANTTYVVSYHTDAGFYSGDGAFFQSAGVTRTAAGACQRRGRTERRLPLRFERLSDRVRSTPRTTGLMSCSTRPRWWMSRRQPSRRQHRHPARTAWTSTLPRRRHSART